MTQSHEHSPLGRVVAVLSALALSLIGVAGVVSPASAEEFGNVNTNLDGKIIIHKHQHQTGTPVKGSPAGGTALPAPIEGVTFTAYRVNDIDLTNQNGWTAAKALIPTCPPPADTTTNAGHATTDGNGMAEIPLSKPTAVGAYIVCETDAPSTVVDRAQPFVVTIPFSYQRKVDGTDVESWLYDVNVFPKNSVTSISKTVRDQSQPGLGLGLGATAEFPVTTKVSKIDADSSYTHYWVQDVMPSQITPATSATVKLDGTALTLGTDFKVSKSGQVVTVEFTQAGLINLQNAAVAGTVDLETTFSGVVASVSSDGIASGTAWVSAATQVGTTPPASPETPKNPGGSGYVGTASEPVSQRWGDFQLSKIDAGDPTAPLDDAKFVVYAAKTAYVTGECTSTETSGGPIVIDGVGSLANPFKTEGGGALRIKGLFVSDSVHDTKDATQRCYVVEEVEAPAGYVLPDDPKTAITVKAGITDGVDKAITNTRISGVVLPMTGSNGIVALTVAGVALIAVGLLLAFLARRRKQTA